MKLPFTKKPVKMPVFERPDYPDGAVLSSSLARFDAPAIAESPPVFKGTGRRPRPVSGRF